MSRDRQDIPESLLLVWYVAVAPVVGALMGVVGFEALSPAWSPAGLRLACAALAGTCGLLLGGMFGALALNAHAICTRRPAN